MRFLTVPSPFRCWMSGGFGSIRNYRASDHFGLLFLVLRLLLFLAGALDSVVVMFDSVDGATVEYVFHKPEYCCHPSQIFFHG